ncbi:Dephospho-CoA_kinase [Hexamita inflata]|uniref:Dephospho-CoA kinase n=1 Tax=Hexamita inflata TaxID=28002 RepID=A0AA86PSR8_9EUKA|nr:Dephospho-CoA kinase [Hexamita inflata]
MKIIVLTGQIGTGKSTIAKALNDLGASIIDTDILSRELQLPGAQVYKQLINKFGNEIIGEDKQINRAKLGEIVFADKSKLELLNSLTHPAISKQMIMEAIKISFALQQGMGVPSECKKLRKPKIIVLVVPLYFEAKINLQLPVVNIGVTDQEQWITRIEKRDGIKGVNKVKAQMSLQDRENLADFCVRNDSLEDVPQKSKQIFEFALQTKSKLISKGFILEHIAIVILPIGIALIAFLAMLRRQIQ